MNECGSINKTLFVDNEIQLYNFYEIISQAKMVNFFHPSEYIQISLLALLACKPYKDLAHRL